MMISVNRMRKFLVLLLSNLPEESREKIFNSIEAWNIEYIDYDWILNDIKNKIR